MAKRNQSLKLLVDKENQRVLFAEARKEVVDFLFSLLALPVGTAARLLTPQGMVGSLGNLYHSVEHMDGTYMRAGFDKDALLKPTLPCNTSCQSTFLMESSQSSSAKKYYGCSPGSCRNRGGFGGSSSYVYVTDGTGVLCPACGRPMTAELTYVPPKQEEVTGGDGGGYVKEVATYMVMDDLSVEPMSTISCITLLNKFHVKDVGSLEERTVELNMDEGLRLLKASFHSNTVLTDVFLRRTAP